jgi:plasmid rolling circle replication initiator protein Rep
MAAIKADKPISYIMLTLTMRNCKPEDLGAELDRLGIAFNKLTKAKQYQEAIKGFYRAVEVTHNVEEGTFHPHIHAVLAVNPSYFTHRTYISQEGWTKLWRQTLRVDYDPIVHVQKVKGNTAKAIAEIAKYGLKTTDYILPDDWDLTVDTVYLLDKVLAYRRFVGFGGIFRDYHKKLNLDDAEEGDLVDLDGDGFVDSRASADSMLVHYAWFSGYRQYMQVEI